MIVASGAITHNFDWLDFAAGADQPPHPRALAFADWVGKQLDNAVYVDGEKATVTWHSSCHGLREMGLGEEPRALFAQLANVTVVPLKREKECCGFGGTFSVRYPDISSAMVADKIAAVAGSGASVVLSADAACLLNIGGAMEKAGAAARPMHLAEFLWERTRER